MANWKKIIISGSNAILNSVTASNGYFGTASFAINASTASFLSGTVVSASYATTASFATTASYVLNAVSSSFATTSNTASYVLNSVSSSFARNSSTASYVLQAVSSSFATTASYVLNSVSSSFATNSSTASYVLNSVSSSFATTSNTSSYVLNAVSSSFATNSSTASYVLNSVSSSFATSASFASTASFLSGTVVSASYATTASFATTASYVSNVPPPSTMNITDDNTNAVYYPVFVDGAGSGKTLYADTTTTPISINPNTGEFKLSNTLKIQSNVNGNRIAIGHNAGQTSQGTSSVAIGYNAGNDFQKNYSVAMGYGAGATSQGEYSTAIGTQAGGTTQGTGSTAVGYQAGLSVQGNYSVAIGYQAGVTSLGESSIAIGRNAGYSNQPAKTIIINASGSYSIPYVANQTSSFYVAPIRASTYTSGALYYNSTTNEITSLLPGTETTATSASFASTASYVLQSVSASFATTSSYVSNVPNIINNASLGRILLSDGTTNAATASSNLSWNSGNESLDITNGGIEQIGAGYTSTFAGGVTINGSLTATSSKAVSSSFATNSSTASYVLNAVSASFATTASFVNTLTQNVTVSGSIFLSGSLNTPVFVDYEERFSTPGISIAPSPGELILNLANGNVFNVALNANITTLTISNPPAANNAGSFVLVFTADGNPRAVTWGASILWPGGTAPTLTSTNGKRDVFGFISLNTGSNWYGFIGGQNI